MTRRHNKDAVRETLSPVRFHDEVLGPELQRRLDSAFPEFDFVPTSGGWWIARGAPSAFSAYGHEKRKLTANEWGLRSYKASCPPVSWTDYVSDVVPARGSAYVAALREIARRLGVDASALGGCDEAQHSGAVHERERRAVVFEAFLAVSRDDLRSPQGESARAYLHARGFDDTDIEGLEIGHVADLGRVRAELIRRGVPAEDVDASGVLADTRWRNRVIGAWRGPNGRIGTFFARAIDTHAPAGQRYLYLARPERGWAEAKADLIVFGADRVRRQSGPVLLVEGVLAAWKLQRRGFEAALGLGGDLGGLTRDRWRRLAGLGVRHAVLCADNDPRPDGSWPGRDGLLRAIEHLRESELDLPAYVVDPAALGDCKGPDDLVDRHGPAALRALVSQATPAPLFAARERLDAITLVSPEPERRAVAEEVLDHASTWGSGRWRPRDLDLVVDAVTTATGFDASVLDAIVDARVEARLREHTATELSAALAATAASLGAGDDPLSIARDLTAMAGALEVPGQALPPEFRVDHLLEESRAQPPGLSTGFRALDAVGVEFVPGELTVTAARTGHGKTTLQVSLLARAVRGEAARSGDGLVVMLSYEEPRTAIFHRLLAQFAPDFGARWSVAEIRDYLRAGSASRPNYEFPDVKALEAAIDELRWLERLIQVAYVPRLDVDATCAYLRRLADRRAIRVVFADYIQRIRPSGAGDRRDIDVSGIARDLKQLAVELNVPVVAGAQVNREAMRGGRAHDDTASFDDPATQEALRARRPQLHQLREGGIEQEADQVLGLLLLRQDFIAPDDSRAPLPNFTPFEVARLKHRFGPGGGATDLVSDATAMRVLDPSEATR